MKIAFVATFAAVAGYGVYTNQKVDTMTDLMLANVEDGGSVVSCYCKTNIFSHNVCSANASGAYCGGDPCSNHDGNCR